MEIYDIVVLGQYKGNSDDMGMFIWTPTPMLLYMLIIHIWMDFPVIKAGMGSSQTSRIIFFS